MIIYKSQDITLDKNFINLARVNLGKDNSSYWLVGHQFFDCQITLKIEGGINCVHTDFMGCSFKRVKGSIFLVEGGIFAANLGQNPLNSGKEAYFSEAQPFSFLKMEKDKIIKDMSKQIILLEKKLNNQKRLTKLANKRYKKIKKNA